MNSGEDNHNNRLMEYRDDHSRGSGFSSGRERGRSRNNSQNKRPRSRGGSNQENMSYNIEKVYNSESVKDNLGSDGLKNVRKRISSNHIARKDPFYEQSFKFRTINHHSIESGDS